MAYGRGSVTVTGAVARTAPRGILAAMKSEVRFPRPMLDRAGKVAEVLNAKQAGDLSAHDVIRACAARALGLPCPIDEKALDVAIDAERKASNSQ